MRLPGCSPAPRPPTKGICPQAHCAALAEPAAEAALR